MYNALVTCGGPFSLDDLAARIRKSSNFRFDRQFYRCSGINPRSAQDVRVALDAIIASPVLHQFLRDSFEPMYADAFDIKPLHEHCQVATAEGEFENLLARAAGDRLGAYSQLGDASRSERKEVRELFASVGDYYTYQLLPGDVPDCPTCRVHNNHLFTTWFYDVAWDWCLFAVWPGRDLLWMGCLTDTD